VIEAFTAWCKDTLYTPEIVRATAILERSCDLQLLLLFHRLGLTEVLGKPLDGAEIAKSLGFVDSASVTLDQMLQRLAVRTPVVRVDNGTPRKFVASGAKIDPVATQAELDTLAQGMAALGERYLASLEFLQFGAEKFVHALKDDPELMDRMLSGREKGLEELWDRATNFDPLQDLHGAMGAEAITSFFQGGTILEIGGGTGNGVRHLFPALEKAGKLSQLTKYLFSDISFLFVLGTKKIIRASWPNLACDYLYLDLNKPFVDQKVPLESVDLVYAVNAAHVAKDLLWSLEQCRASLKPGGKVVFAERVRTSQAEMAPRELVLNLSIYHRSASERSSYRPFHCYLRPENWREALEKAGFSKVEIWPDMAAIGEKFPGQYAAVVVATK